MTVDLALARKAHKTGLTGFALGEKLGVSTRQAHTLAHVGARLERIESHVLTDAEIAVMKAIAALTLEGLAEGATRSPETRRVSARCRKSPGWCSSVVRKRLFLRRHDKLKGREVHGLGLVELAGNGFVWLTPAGWALVHALEVTR